MEVIEWTCGIIMEDWEYVRKKECNVRLVLSWKRVLPFSR